MQPSGSPTPSARGIRFLGLQWFAVVMGWSGLGLAWLRAQPLLGETASLAAYGAAGLACIAFGLVLAASVLRLVRHRAALLEDLRHPVRHAFLAACPVSLMLLCTLLAGLGLSVGALSGLWLFAVGVEFLVTVWVIDRWLREGLNWAAMTPVVFIPIVGNVVVPLGASAFDQPALGVAFLGIGAFAWPVVLALILARTAIQALPERLLATWFISVAPAAVIGVAVPNLGGPGAVALGALGVATCFLAASLRLLPRIARGGFGMPLWALSFPLAAYAALTLRVAVDHPALKPFALLALGLATLIIIGLSVLTLRGLLKGELLVPEPAGPSPSPTAGAAASA